MVGDYMEVYVVFVYGVVFVVGEFDGVVEDWMYLVGFVYVFDVLF